MNNVTQRKKPNREIETNSSLDVRPSSQLKMADVSKLERGMDALLTGFTEVKQKVGDMEKSVNFLSAQFDTLSTEIKAHSSQIAKLNDKNTKMEDNLFSANT